jgi:Domain of unknown function (DUF5655)/Domain of unknown function (DUF4287)
MRASIERNMLERTGKPLDHWVELVRAKGLSGHGPVTKYLMAEHGFTRGYAGAVAWALREETVTPDELVGQQYAGKETLRPVLDAVRKAIPAGADEGARKTYVTWSNGRQFALLQPSTKERADLGLVLERTAASQRLQAAGSFGSGRITHRVALASARDVDAEVKGWLRRAFDLAAR